ncbi:hypothetical protein AB0K51_25760 [Kitasatospora sp. NPDC049285]|uniref:hypothetical protein n=1 Tax=Kitasatospora sp. NPDC049285 TaxID=3157096 RepID=UPI00342DB429
MGLFSLAGSLAEAEAGAGALVVRATAGDPGLAGFEVVQVGAALVPGPWWGFD